MDGMRVLVTGADGYIGAVLGPRLIERGFDVVAAFIATAGSTTTPVHAR